MPYLDPWRENVLEDLRERKKRYDSEFQLKQVSIDVYRANLYSLGYRGKAIETEVNLNWPKLK